MIKAAERDPQRSKLVVLTCRTWYRGHLVLSIQIFLDVFAAFASSIGIFLQSVIGTGYGLENAGRRTMAHAFAGGLTRQVTA
jgi:transketolase C-terminal domain/subunit